jgi:hypothetical protein
VLAKIRELLVNMTSNVGAVHDPHLEIAALPLLAQVGWLECFVHKRFLVFSFMKADDWEIPPKLAPSKSRIPITWLPGA